MSLGRNSSLSVWTVAQALAEPWRKLGLRDGRGLATVIRSIGGRAGNPGFIL